MTLFTKKEKIELKLKLTKLMERFIETECEDDNNFGWVPNEIESMMANAAFSVLETVNATNSYIEENDLLRD